MTVIEMIVRIIDREWHIEEEQNKQFNLNLLIDFYGISC
jgi:hypothetical protein